MYETFYVTLHVVAFAVGLVGVFFAITWWQQEQEYEHYRLLTSKTTVRNGIRDCEAQMRDWVLRGRPDQVNDLRRRRDFLLRRLRELEEMDL